MKTDLRVEETWRRDTYTVGKDHHEGVEGFWLPTPLATCMPGMRTHVKLKQYGQAEIISSEFWMEIVKQRKHFSTTGSCRKSAHLMAFSSRKVHLCQQRNSEHRASMGFGRLRTAD